MSIGRGLLAGLAGTAAMTAVLGASRALGLMGGEVSPRQVARNREGKGGLLEGLPGIALGSTSPVSRRLLNQRFMVGIDTEKVLATSSLGTPRSTAPGRSLPINAQLPTHSMRRCWPLSSRPTRSHASASICDGSRYSKCRMGEPGSCGLRSIITD